MELIDAVFMLFLAFAGFTAGIICGKAITEVAYTAPPDSDKQSLPILPKQAVSQPEIAQTPEPPKPKRSFFELLEDYLG